MFQGVASGGTAGGDSDLAIDRGQVCIDGARADDKAFGDLGVAEPAGNQAQHLDLPSG